MSSSTVPTSRTQQKLRGIILFSGIGFAALGGLFIWIQSGLTVARGAFEQGEYAAARSSAARYLWLHPGNIDARMVVARSYALDDELPGIDAARSAIQHLQQVPATAAQAAEARVLEGRLTFLILHQPARGEALLREAIALDPSLFDAYFMLWKLLDMTERYFMAEPAFREAFRLAPVEQRPHRLREWYLSQFAPLSACGEMDHLMGFREFDQPTGELIAFARLTAFMEQEPAAPAVVAAYAQWCLRNRERAMALEALEGIPQADAALTDVFYALTLCEVLIELGQFERAEQVFAQIPSSTDGYFYCRVAGILHHESRQDYSTAADFYRKALADWPGPSDWTTMHRLVRCLTLAGEPAESEMIREHADRVQQLMDPELHQRLKTVLLELDNPAALQEVVDFYLALERDWEVEAWQDVIDGLRLSNPAGDDSQAGIMRPR